jgi:hypothetical protein
LLIFFVKKFGSLKYFFVPLHVFDEISLTKNCKNHEKQHQIFRCFAKGTQLPDNHGLNLKGGGGKIMPRP